MFILLSKKIMAFLRSKILLNWTIVSNSNLYSSLRCSELVLLCHFLVILIYFHKLDKIHLMRGSRGGTGVRTAPPHPLKNHKNIGFLSNSGPDLLKNHKATKPAIQFWDIISTPAKRHLKKWHFAGGPMMARL